MNMYKEQNDTILPNGERITNFQTTNTTEQIRNVLLGWLFDVLALQDL